MVATFITEFMAEPEDEEDTSEFDAWIGGLVHLYHDNSLSQDAYMVYMNLQYLTTAMYDLRTYATLAVYNHLLLEIGAWRASVRDWLQRANLHTVTKIPFPSSIRPFRFSGQHFKLLYIACLVFEVNDIHGKPFIFF